MDGGGHLERRSRLSIRLVQVRRKASGQGGLGVTLGNQGYLGQGCARKHEDQQVKRIGLVRRSPLRSTDGDHRNGIWLFRSTSGLAINPVMNPFSLASTVAR